MRTIGAKRRAQFALAALTISLGLGLAACQGDTTVTNTPADTAGITVSGRGEVDTPPDIGFLTLGVQSTATTVAEARENAATSIAAVIAAIKADGVVAKDIQTTGLSIQPNYDYNKTPNTPEIVSYTVTNTVSTKVRNLDTLSAVIDNAIAAGGDDTRLQGIQFGVDDQAAAKEGARAEAMADAKAKAEQLASLGGVTLGPPVTIAEVVAAPNYGYQLLGGIAYQDAALASTPIETGTNLVSVEVTVRYSVQ